MVGIFFGQISSFLHSCNSFIVSYAGVDQYTMKALLLKLGKFSTLQMKIILCFRLRLERDRSFKLGRLLWKPWRSRFAWLHLFPFPFCYFFLFWVYVTKICCNLFCCWFAGWGGCKTYMQTRVCLWHCRLSARYPTQVISLFLTLIFFFFFPFLFSLSNELFYIIAMRA